ncbi:MAG: hypothetical protein HC879_06060 [Leptolyngbyaceae cyanobacterium SL_5_9]|nr:hypothetical protein [Leptolyngbyaceae cyanobacterium SL_5_9]NJO74643.1 hypothetical protein [Leptolyngbyaceae cyanobacterium RM1_406_9]
MPSPGRYQSSVFNFLNRRSLQLSEQVRRTVRSVKMTASWSVQILLYPAYVAFQTGRVTAQQLRQAVQTTSLRLKTVEKAIQKVKHVNAPPRLEPSLSSDTPIYRALQTVEAFALLPTAKSPLERVSVSDLSIQADQASELAIHYRPAQPNATEDRTTDAEIVVSQNGAVSASAASENGAVSLISLTGATGGNGAARSLSLSGKIIGIASLLTSRSLVLVTNQGQLLDILTTEQQAQLHRRIVWEVAHYWRTRRDLWAQQPAPFPLPLPEVRQNALPPVRMVRRLMAWMQTSSVAIATNLFQESALVASLQAEQAIAHTQTVNLSKPRVEDPWTEDDDTSGFVEMTEFSETAINPWKRRRQAALNPLAGTPSRLLKSSRFSGLFPFAGRRQGFAEATQTNPQTDRFGKIFSGLKGIRSESRLAQVERAESKTGAIAPSPSPKPGSTLQPSQPNTPGQIEQSNSQDGSSNLQAPWIETEATLVGYVKHPLEQILEWLDSGMVWIEEILAKAWNWLRRRQRK